MIKNVLYINEVILGTAFGVLMGPYCADVLDPRSWGPTSNRITLEVLRVVLVVGLFIIGVQLPKRYLLEHLQGMLVMVIPTMAFGWVVIAIIINALFPSLSFVSSLAISACLTPTDPIICSAIVGGKFAEKHVREDLRDILSAESAANDGLAYPFLSLSLYLVLETSTKTAIGKWLLIGCLYQVILGTVLGATLGLGFCKVMKFLYARDLLDPQSYPAQFVALALLTGGLESSLLTPSDIVLLTKVPDRFPLVIDTLLNCGCFIYIGAWLPFREFSSPDLGIAPWRLVVLFLAVLALRRIPPILLLYKWVHEIDGWQEALVAGHFGPMGVSALFVSTMAITTWLPPPHYPPQNQQEYLAATLPTLVAFVVLGSIIVHGFSISLFSLGRALRFMTRKRNPRNPTDDTESARAESYWGPSLTTAPTIPDSGSDKGVEQGSIRESSGPRTPLWSSRPPSDIGKN
ncbi:hypothetical protein NLI96_g3569 [Meripilus lineatus]|uniref:Cation/H+ exchanger transmembrane domain-containing protein n=1 Tax=Meripilus lineatus TaxID=2056292 RepID=A0AAD5V6K4_9APHY|nr:hypothetical protein NLI96_g3569 [Physisporinus lineatus]